MNERVAHGNGKLPGSLGIIDAARVNYSDEATHSITSPNDLSDVEGQCCRRE